MQDLNNVTIIAVVLVALPGFINMIVNLIISRKLKADDEQRQTIEKLKCDIADLKAEISVFKVTNMTDVRVKAIIQETVKATVDSMKVDLFKEINSYLRGSGIKNNG